MGIGFFRYAKNLPLHPGKYTASFWVQSKTLIGNREKVSGSNDKMPKKSPSFLSDIFGNQSMNPKTLYKIPLT